MFTVFTALQIGYSLNKKYISSERVGKIFRIYNKKKPFTSFTVFKAIYGR